jgi:hypothetical protein
MITTIKSDSSTDYKLTIKHGKAEAFETKDIFLSIHIKDDFLDAMTVRLSFEKMVELRNILNNQIESFLK